MRLKRSKSADRSWLESLSSLDGVNGGMCAFIHRGIVAAKPILNEPPYSGYIFYSGYTENNFPIYLPVVIKQLMYLIIIHFIYNHY